MKRKLTKLKYTFWLFYFCNQYIYRFLTGKYGLQRTLAELEWELSFSKKRIEGE